jgi:hypothetical protein
MNTNTLKKQIEKELKDQEGFLRFRLWESRCGGKTTHYLSFGNSESEKADTLWELGSAAVDACKEIGGAMKTETYMGIEFPLTLCVIEPTKEFLKVKSILDKWGDRKLGQYESYSVNQFGKRGHYSDSGTPYYLCGKWCVKKCEHILKWLKANRKGKNTIKIETIERVDHEDEQYSRYYETECYGARAVHLVLTILTPGGKERARQEFWLNL